MLLGNPQQRFKIAKAAKTIIRQLLADSGLRRGRVSGHAGAVQTTG
jgi:hypothetical protein